MQLDAILRQSPLLSAVFENWDQIQLNDAWLVAGCVAQTVWNHRFGLPHAHGLSDIDIVYFDPNDLSEDAEQAHAARIAKCFTEIPVRFDVKNEARVHLWYEAKFGYPVPQYPSVEAAIATFPTTATAIGIRPVSGALQIYAPFGQEDLMNGRVRPNKAQITREIYEAKVNRWLSAWPELEIIKWEDA